MADRYRKNQRLFDSARLLLRDPRLESTPRAERRRLARSRAKEYHLRIPQDAELQGAGSDIERAFTLLAGKGGEDIATMSTEDRLVAISMCDDLQYLNGEVDTRSYQSFGANLCVDIMNDNSLDWTRQEKITAAMMWENFAFESLRQHELRGADTYEQTEKWMTVSIANFLKAKAAHEAMPNQTTREHEHYLEVAGFIYEWAMVILHRQKAIAADGYGHVAVRHANQRMDSCWEGHVGPEDQSGNFDILVTNYDDDGQLDSRRYIQTKYGRTSKRKYRKPIKKATKTNIYLEEVVESVSRLARLYASLDPNAPEAQRYLAPRFSDRHDNELIDKVLTSVVIE
jgi:hypothetical protein